MANFDVPSLYRMPVCVGAGVSCTADMTLVCHTLRHSIPTRTCPGALSRYDYVVTVFTWRTVNYLLGYD